MQLELRWGEEEEESSCQFERRENGCLLLSSAKESVVTREREREITL